MSNKNINSQELSYSDIKELLNKKKMQLQLKRVFDIIVSFLGLLVLSPILMIVSLIIKLSSEGPIFFRQVRVGRHGKEFRIYKFRTMVVNAEKLGMQITVGKDPRITKIGHVLRKTKMDELPQLINVLNGTMSFVGPRPEVPKYVNLYTQDQKGILLIRPGITDLASIEYRDESALLAQSNDPEKVYIEEIMTEKIRYNLEYIKIISIEADIRLICKTIFIILKRG